MFADDAAGVLEHLEIPTAHIFGVSMGGMIAQEFALRHAPHDAYGDARMHHRGRNSFGAAAARIVEGADRAARGRLARRRHSARMAAAAITPEYIANHRDELEAAIPRLLKHPTPPFAFQRQLEGTYTLQTWDRLPQIKAPTLVITGAKDVLIPAKNSELLASRIPGAKLHLIPNAGHALHDRGPEEFLRVVSCRSRNAHPIGN